MKHWRTKTIILLCCMGHLYTTPLCASHIVGGDVTYNIVSYNQDSSLVTYAVEFIIYRDTAGLDFDFLGDFGVFNQLPNGLWESYQVINEIPIAQITQISAVEDPCKNELLSDLIIESGTYNFNVILEVGEQNYMVAYQRCCRNFTINNILRPGETGAVYDIIITPEAQKEGNNSPEFKEFPPIFVCQGFDFDFDHSAIDQDGNELMYSFCTPFISGINPGSAPAICCDCVKPDPETCLPGFDNVTYIDIYNARYPVGGDPLITIDPISGLITGVPNLLGSYVVGICVEELRDGVVIGNYRRDFEFNVGICTPRVVADLESDVYEFDPEGITSHKVHQYTSCDSLITITNLSTDIDFIDDYKWMIYDEDNNLIIQNQGLSVRDVNLNLPGTGIYRGLMVLNESGKCVDTAFIRIDILPLVDLSFDYNFDLCQNGPIQLTNTSTFTPGSILTWDWMIDGSSIGQDFNAVSASPDMGPHTISLSVKDRLDCEATIEQDIFYNYYEAPVITDDIYVTVCKGDTVYFEGRSVTESGIYEQIYYTIIDDCDSLIRRLDLRHFPPPDTILIDTTICNGTSTLFDEVIIDMDGRYFKTIDYSYADCDSVVFQLDLTVSPFPIFIQIDTMLCADESILFQNRLIREAGTYMQIIKSTTTQCDSFEYILNVAFDKPMIETSSDTTICAGDSIRYQESWLHVSGLYDNRLSAKSGCDSLHEIFNLIVKDPLSLIVVCQDSIRPLLDYQIEAEVNEHNIDIRWTPTDGLSCDDCLNPIVNISEDQTYFLEIWDNQGCYISKEITLFVDPIIDFYLPNIISNHTPISPANQFFFLQNSPDYSFQYNMSIYDRWGSQVGHKTNITTNVADDGWAPQDYLPGIYVYYIEVLADVEPRILAGDLTVIK